MSSSRQGAELASKLIEASGARAADHITIAGTRHLDLLLALYGRGFCHVACQATNQECPHDAQSAADILLVPHLEDERELSAVLARLAPVLRKGGKLVVGAVGKQEVATRLRRLLAERGFAAMSWSLNGEPEDLMLC